MDFLEQLASGPHPPIVVVSSSTPDKSAKSIAAIKAGAFACFDKARLVQDAPRFVKVLRRAADVVKASRRPYDVRHPEHVEGFSMTVCG